MLNGTLKNTVDVLKVNTSLLNKELLYAKGKLSLSFIYDGSDIRKGESVSSECLGWVKDLRGNWLSELCALQ